MRLTVLVLVWSPPGGVRRERSLAASLSLLLSVLTLVFVLAVARGGTLVAKHMVPDHEQKQRRGMSSGGRIAAEGE